ncbi:MAG: hypothetical protein V1810_03435 [Candidatus Beckwithbacteria bacterium]
MITAIQNQAGRDQFFQTGNKPKIKVDNRKTNNTKWIIDLLVAILAGVVLLFIGKFFKYYFGW